MATPFLRAAASAAVARAARTAMVAKAPEPPCGRVLPSHGSGAAGALIRPVPIVRPDQR